MSRFGETLACLGLAAGAHLAALAWFASNGTPGAGGGESGGAMLVGADAALTAMIATWDAAPVASASPEAQFVKPAEASPVVAASEPEPAPQAAAATPARPDAASSPIAPLEPAPPAVAADAPRAPVIAEAAPAKAGISVGAARDESVGPAPQAPETRAPEAGEPLEVAEITTTVSPLPQPRPERVAAKTAPRAPTRVLTAARAPASEAPTGTGESAAAPAAPGVASASLQPAKSGGDGGGGARARLTAEWGAAIRAEVEQAKRYPESTRRTGAARVALRVGRSGALLSAALTESAGASALDRAALAAVERAAPFPAAPAALAGESFDLSLRIVFRR